MSSHKINHANIKEWAKNYDGELFDGILCDPPYHLVSMTKRWGGDNSHNTPIMNTKEGGVFARSAKGFMGKDWDGVDENGLGIAQDPEMWHLLFKLLKPGAHLLAFSGSRTYHRMAVAIEDAGFEIRDMIEWVYGSGFPKSLNIGKAVDKIQGNEREYIGEDPIKTAKYDNSITKGTSPYEGYGTALKPAHEPCVLARKPIEGTVANNVLKHGTGGLNIDGTRVGYQNEADKASAMPGTTPHTEMGKGSTPIIGGIRPDHNPSTGRFPANLIHDGSDEVVAVFPQSKTNEKRTGINPLEVGGVTFKTRGSYAPRVESGSASRFFYTAKASKSERNAGLEGFEPQFAPKGNNEGRDMSNPKNHMGGMQGSKMQNHHPTVKPLSLTKYLATLIKPPTGGRLLVPFSGSGSEMIGGLQAGWEYVEGVELTEEYIPIAEARIKYWTKDPEQRKLL